MLEVVAAKLHNIQVTECFLEYHGSVTIDEEILEQAKIPPGAFVYIWNKQSGARISTYTLPGKRGSRTVCLNGAAARLNQPGDSVIITLSVQAPLEDLKDREAHVLCFTHEKEPNEVKDHLMYKWDSQGKFSIVPS